MKRRAKTGLSRPRLTPRLRAASFEEDLLNVPADRSVRRTARRIQGPGGVRLKTVMNHSGQIQPLRRITGKHPQTWRKLMSLRILPGGAIAALAGAAMLALSSAPSPAFTLSSASLERPVAAADIEPVWWHGGWHYGWHRGHGVADGDGMAAGIAGAGVRDMALDPGGGAGGPRGACAAAAGSEGPRESGLLLGRTEKGRPPGELWFRRCGKGRSLPGQKRSQDGPGRP